MTNRTIDWTEDAYNCLQLGTIDQYGQFKPACLACPIYSIPLETFPKKVPFCGIATLMPTLLHRLGAPRITENSHGNRVIIGSKEVIYNDIHASVAEQIKARHGVTISELLELLPCTKYSAIESALKRGLANGYISRTRTKQKKDGRTYTVNEYFWIGE
jgi:hypothetical protein